MKLKKLQTNQQYMEKNKGIAMAEEFQARICGENYWCSSTIDSTRSVFSLSSSSISSLCSVAAIDAGNNSTRQTTNSDLKATKCCGEDTTNNLVSDTYLGFVDAQKPQKSESASGSGSMFIDSTLQMMGFGLTPSTSENWYQPLLFRCNGRAESNFHSVIHEKTEIDSSNSQIHRDWIPKSFSSGGNQIENFKPLNQEFSLDHQSLSSLLTTTGLSSNLGFPIGSASSYGNPSTLQSLYDPNPNPNYPHPQTQHSLFTNRPMSYSSKAFYGTPCTQLQPTSSKVSTFFKPTIAKQHPIGLHFSNSTPFWNTSSEAFNDIRIGTFASPQSQYQAPTFEEKPNCPSTLLNKLKSEETLDSASVEKKNVCEPALKRPRIETPSPIPTFKVRKEKLGDRVTALQQLVSPFGKTDTASVLHEAIEYIKFLHDQVNVLSTSYMKNGAPIRQKQGCDDLKDSEKDLKSRGLCLVPISSTFPVSTESTNAELWTPTLFRGTLLR